MVAAWDTVQAEDFVGRQLGRYRIERVLGVGGVAAVYAAMDVALHRRVALKVLLPLPALSPSVLERFRLEAVTAARLDHPGIVPIYDVGEAEGVVYIAMKLIPGETLGDVLARAGRLHEQDAAALIAQVAEALHYAHRHGVVHRDVKPANILLNWELEEPTGRRYCHAYLTDFGVARALDAPDLTQAGFTVGTPAYMSPEQAVGDHALDGRSDLYSLGVVLYHCLAGHPPFTGGTAHVLHAHVYETPPPLPADVSPAMTEIVTRALAKDPAERYQTGEEMALALRALPASREAESASFSSPDAEALTDASRARVPGLRLRLLVGLMVLVVLVGGGAFLTVGRLGGSAPTPTPTKAPVLAQARPVRRFTPPPTNTPIPTPTPTPTPTRRPTPTPTASPQRAQVPPLPSPTPAPTATPTSTPTPSNLCPIAPHVAFAEWLALPERAEAIGCPVADAVTSPALFQRFERGQMIAREDFRQIYVIYDDGSWEVFEDTWQEGDPVLDPNLTPPAGMRQPERRLGKLWRTRERVRQSLGWATSEEIPFNGIFQAFEHGQLIAQPPGRVYVLLEDRRLRLLSSSGSNMADAGG